ncbi:WD40 repeat protein [Tenacibaculum litopenaei]
MYKTNMKKYHTIVALVLLSYSCTTAEIPEAASITIDRKVTYERDIKPIMYTNCLTCHSAVNPRNGLILETYQQVKASASTGTLIQRMNDAANPMPQGGLLTPDKRALVDKWKSDGYLEN